MSDNNSPSALLAKQISSLTYNAAEAGKKVTERGEALGSMGTKTTALSNQANEWADSAPSAPEFSLRDPSPFPNVDPNNVNNVTVTFEYGDEQYTLKVRGKNNKKLGETRQKDQLFITLFGLNWWNTHTTYQKTIRDYVAQYISTIDRTLGKINRTVYYKNKEQIAHNCTCMLHLFAEQRFPDIPTETQKQLAIDIFNYDVDKSSSTSSTGKLLAQMARFVRTKLPEAGGGAKSSKKAHRNPFRTRSRRRARRSRRRRVSRTSRRTRTR